MQATTIAADGRRRRTRGIFIAYPLVLDWAKTDSSSRMSEALFPLGRTQPGDLYDVWTAATQAGLTVLEPAILLAVWGAKIQFAAGTMPLCRRNRIHVQRYSGSSASSAEA